MEGTKNPNRLNGQWVGMYTGTTAGDIHVNIDEHESGYRGVAYLFNNVGLPPAVAFFSIPNREARILSSYRRDSSS